MSIISLHVEPSSHCNARCPGCPRNGYGYPLQGFFEEKHIDIGKYERILVSCPEVKEILFCGNHGDPMMNRDIAQLCSKKNIHYTIATNGGIGRLETYETLAAKGVVITFGIDGLEDTNHLYRQGVKWRNLMDRVKTFINKGGKAQWQFIKFKHNMHQVEKARIMSEELGFMDFSTLDVGRNNMPAIQPDKSISHWILPPEEDAQPYDFDVDEYLNMRYNPYYLGKSKCKVSDISCEHLDGMVYVNSSGEVFPCCYQGFGHVDRPKVFLEDFKKLQDTWETDQCDEVCAGSCGAP